jgi:hypothetical protein
MSASRRPSRAIAIVALFVVQMATVASTRAADEVKPAAAPQSSTAPAITRIWLSHVSPDPGRMTISFETVRDGDTVVEYGPTESLGETQRRDEAVRLHQAEVPIPVKQGPWFYRVRSGEQASAIVKTRGYDDGVLKVAVVGNLGYATGKWQEAILREQPHLLLSAGDNVGEAHAPLVNGKRSKDNIANFRKLIDSSPELFRTIPFMPILGNHDREIRPRGPGPKPPEEKVYDIDATAYRKFFALPGDEWKWHFDFPEFGACFIALDLNHTQDDGTNWQTCHAYGKGSEQLAWYRATMERKPFVPFVFTLNNEKLSVFRGLAGGEWWKTAWRGSAVATGFGYFAERAVVDEHPMFNTSVGGKGSVYKDPKSNFLASEDNYLLLTFEKKLKVACTADLKSLDGSLLSRAHVWPTVRLGDDRTKLGPQSTQSLVIRNGGTKEKPVVYDFAGLTIDLGLDVSDRPWIRDGDIWRSRGKLLGREPIMAGQTAGLFIEGFDKETRSFRPSLPLSVPRNLAAEKLKPEKKGFCYFAVSDLQPGQMGYADDGSLHFRWPKDVDPEKARVILPPAPGTSCVSIQCSHVTVKNLTVRHAANDGFNIHNKWVGVRLENVRAISNGDEGISAHGEVEMTVVDSEVAYNGSAAGGVADVDRSVTRYERCRVHDNAGAAFYFSGKSHTVVDTTIERQPRDFSIAPTSTVVKERIRYEP